jgi:hypothetical protein
MSQVLTFRSLVSATCTAGVWGSVAGTALFVRYFAVTGSSGDFMILLLSPLIFMISAAATVPMAVVAGVVTFWPVRKWVARIPILAIIPSSVGGLLGYLISSRLLLGLKPSEADDAWIIGLFVTTTAISLVICVWRAVRSSDEELAERLI